MEQQSDAITVFCCYANADEDLFHAFQKHLSPLEKQNVINIWHNGKIPAGTEWEQEIKKHLNEARIILLLISSDFFSYSDSEMECALARHEQQEARVIPIILRHVAWPPAGNKTLGRLRALPKNGKPVSAWEDHDEAWKEAAEEIERVVNEWQRKPLPLSSDPSALLTSEENRLASGLPASGRENKTDRVNIAAVYASLQNSRDNSPSSLQRFAQITKLVDAYYASVRIARCPLSNTCKVLSKKRIPSHGLCLSLIRALKGIGQPLSHLCSPFGELAQLPDVLIPVQPNIFMALCDTQNQIAQAEHSIKMFYKQVITSALEEVFEQREETLHALTSLRIQFWRVRRILKNTFSPADSHSLVGRLLAPDREEEWFQTLPLSLGVQPASSYEGSDSHPTI